MPAAPPGTVTMALGTDISVTITYDPVTGNFLSNPALHCSNSSGAPFPVSITGPNGVWNPRIPVGTTNFSPAQLASQGITNFSQISNFQIAER